MINARKLSVKQTKTQKRVKPHNTSATWPFVNSTRETSPSGTISPTCDLPTNARDHGEREKLTSSGLRTDRNDISSIMEALEQGRRMLGAPKLTERQGRPNETICAADGRQKLTMLRGEVFNGCVESLLINLTAEVLLTRMLTSTTWCTLNRTTPDMTGNRCPFLIMEVIESAENGEAVRLYILMRSGMYGTNPAHQSLITAGNQQVAPASSVGTVCSIPDCRKVN
jgi:hypothetical protein